MPTSPLLPPRRSQPKRDVFEFSDGKRITLGDLPDGLIFDVLVVPGSEQFSTLLDMEPALLHEEEEEKESLLVRLLARIQTRTPIAFDCEEDVVVDSFLAAKATPGPTSATG
jgi:hypothetical protein